MHQRRLSRGSPCPIMSFRTSLAAMLPTTASSPDEELFEVFDIYNRLKFMAQEAGAREQYFKMNEGM